MVSKKQRNRSILVITIIVGLFIVLSQSGGFNLLTLNPPSDLESALGSCDGGQTIISQSDINKVELGGTGRIRITTVAKGNECLEVALTPSVLNSFLDDLGLEATQNINLNIRLKEYTKNFPIVPVSGDTTISKYRKIGDNTDSNTNSFIGGSFTNWCKQNFNSNTIYGYSPSIFNDIRCVQPLVIGDRGTFTGESFGNFKVGLKYANKPEVNIQGVLTNSDDPNTFQQSASLEGGKIKIGWVGMFSNLNNVDTPFQYNGRRIQSRWKLVDSASLNSINSILNTISNENFISDSTFDNLRSSKNNQIENNILIDRIQQYIDRPLIHDASTDNGNLWVSLESPPFPVFVLDLDASYVGIRSLEGNPEITECIPNDIDVSGDSTTVQFKVLNNADANNVEFVSSITCNQGVTGFVPNTQIGANQEKTISATLSSSNPNQGNLKANCQLKVKDSGSGNQDVCNFQRTVEYASGIICTPNSFQCDDNNLNVLQCSSEGKSIEIQETCQFGCKSVSGGAECKTSIDDDEGAISPGGFGFFSAIKSFFSNIFSGVFTGLLVIKYTLIVIGSTVSFFVSRDLFKRIKSIKKNKNVIKILSFVVVFGVGYFLFTFIGSLVFWGILIGILVAGILLNFIPISRLRR